MSYKLGIQIRLFRIAKGFSGEKLAELSDLSTKGLSNIELSKSDPRFSTVKRIVEALDISLDDLVNETIIIVTIDAKIHPPNEIKNVDPNPVNNKADNKTLNTPIMK